MSSLWRCAVAVSMSKLLLASLVIAGALVPIDTFAQVSRALRPRTVAAGSVPEPRFADADRARKLKAAFPEIERLLIGWVDRQHIPGAAMGILIDGELASLMRTGVRDVSARAAVTPETVFRIASMTKSFTAMAILRLRDEGRLSLDEPVERYVPELASLPYPTRDSPVLTIRHLLTHAEGFPEDNPWGDRQLAQPSTILSAWIRAGIPFSNVPGMAYEYSNYGFAILGQVVAKASGQPYQDYIQGHILTPLGMQATTFEASNVPPDRKALGYRWQQNAWHLEPALADGAFGAMGGLWTSTGDLARYVAFLMDAFPPRDEAEKGPISRSSAREMQQAWRARPSLATRDTVDGPLVLNVSAYGYGLGVSQDCQFKHVISHGGGLPGYGSLMRWLPEHGVGLIAFGNVTYASFGGLFSEAVNMLAKTGALQPRVPQPSPSLLQAKERISLLIRHWDDRLASHLAADNLFLDQPAEQRKTYFSELATKHGACVPEPAINTENALRGTWRMTCEQGWLNVSVTLAPTQPPRVQFLQVRSILPPDERMAKVVRVVSQLGSTWDNATATSLVAPDFDLARLRRQFAILSDQWGTCKAGEVVAGDGSRESEVKLSCDRGTVTAKIVLDSATHQLTRLDLTPTSERTCVP